MNPFLLVIDISSITRQEVLNFLDTRPEVLNWYAVFSNSIIVVSNTNALMLQNIIAANFKNTFFLISQINSTTTGGWMNKEVWDFISNPHSSGRWPK